MAEKFCPYHGPYDGSLDECPYCVAEGHSVAPAHSDAPPLPAALEALSGDDSTKADALLPSEEEGSRIEHTLVDHPLSRPTLLGLLWVKAGPLQGKIFLIEHGSVIGRSSGAVAVRDPRVSDPHAKLTLTEEGFVLWDFGSANGTFVNGKRILAATPLAENDEIQVGDTILVLKTLSLEEKQDHG